MHYHEFKLSPSRYHRSLIFLVILTSILIVFCLPIQFVTKLAGGLALIGYGFYLATQLPIRALQYKGEKNWLIFTKQWESACLLGDSTVTGWVSVLRFKIEGKRMPQSCVIFKDALSEGRYRQLVATLKMAG